MQDLDPGIGGATPRHPVLRVLLVEDDPAISEMYGLALRLSGYIVETATCAGAALEAAFKTVPDLVMLDPFLGIGHAAIAAKECGIRRFTGFDIDAEYVEVARKSLAKDPKVPDPELF